MWVFLWNSWKSHSIQRLFTNLSIVSLYFQSSSIFFPSCPYSWVIKCSHWTSPNHEWYMVNAMATFSGDVQYIQNGTVTNPCYYCIWWPSLRLYTHFPMSAFCLDLAPRSSRANTAAALREKWWEKSQKRGVHQHSSTGLKMGNSTFIQNEDGNKIGFWYMWFYRWMFINIQQREGNCYNELFESKRRTRHRPFPVGNHQWFRCKWISTNIITLECSNTIRVYIMERKILIFNRENQEFQINKCMQRGHGWR